MDSDPMPLDDRLLCADIDLRLLWLWLEVWDADELTLERVGAFVRAAYGIGYLGALSEERRGQLCVDHGYAVPRRRRRRG